MPQLKDSGASTENSLVLSLFVPSRPSTDGTRPTHITAGNLLCSVY